MAWVTPSERATGYVVPATVWNQDVVNNILTPPWVAKSLAVDSDVTMVGDNNWNDVTGYTMTITLPYAATVMAMCNINALNGDGVGGGGPHAGRGITRLVIDGTACQDNDESYDPGAVTGVWLDGLVLLGAKACAAGARIVKLQHYGADGDYDTDYKEAYFLAWAMVASA